MEIIIRGKDEHQKLGRTRSEQEANLRKEWGSTMSDEQLDKCKWLEKKKKEFDGSGKNFIPGHQIDVVK
jgi:hypothetical protein